jgi:hypothetical protein
MYADAVEKEKNRKKKKRLNIEQEGVKKKKSVQAEQDYIATSAQLGHFFREGGVLPLP